MWRYFSVAALLAAVMSACSSSNSLRDVGGCMSTAPGVLVAAPGIDFQVRDPYGVAQAIGTTADVKRSTGEPVGSTNYDDTLHLYSAFDIAGTFNATLKRPYYEDAAVANIVVTPDGCLVKTTVVLVTLQLAPGAPAIRSIALVSSILPDHPDNRFQLLAHFDADPSVPRDVSWSSSDTTLATVDANGIVTSKCVKTGGTVTITATASANSSITASTPVAVTPTASCP